VDIGSSSSSTSSSGGVKNALQVNKDDIMKDGRYSKLIGLNGVATMYCFQNIAKNRVNILE
jgi:hypothetical protein